MKNPFLHQLILLTALFFSCSPIAVAQYEDDEDVAQYEDDEAPIYYCDWFEKNNRTTLVNGKINYEAVDMGLSVLWCNVNVGADSLCSVGQFYSFGSTFPQDTTISVPTRHHDLLEWYTGNYKLSERKLDKKQDAATANIKSNWRTPTMAEWEELFNPANCSWTYIADYHTGKDIDYWNYTGKTIHAGFKVTSRITGNSIYLPDCVCSAADYIENSRGAVDSLRVLFTLAKLDNWYLKRFIPIHDLQYTDFGVPVRAVCNYTEQAQTKGTTSSSNRKQKADLRYAGKPANAVDMGLSVKWASWNIGAKNEADSGYYFAWGEVNAKSEYTWRTYTNKDFLKPKRHFRRLSGNKDAANAQWGKGWRIPSAEEWHELVRWCDWDWTDDYEGSGVSGYVVTSPRTGNSIFLPTIGNTDIKEFGEGANTCNYWENNDYPHNKGKNSLLDSCAASFGGLYTNFLMMPLFKSIGCPIRAVQESDDICRKKSQPIDTSVVKNKQPDAVDLGLSVLWASCNLGADDETEYGERFSWGEVNPKSEFTWDNYYWKNTQRYADGNSSQCLKPTDDAAHMRLGGEWRMPTAAELKELTTKCTWRWIGDYNESGVSGYIVRSNATGNFIFFPSVKEQVEYEDGTNTLHSMEFWTSTNRNTHEAYICNEEAIHHEYRYCREFGDWKGKYCGLAIRPVRVKMKD